MRLQFVLVLALVGSIGCKAGTSSALINVVANMDLGDKVTQFRILAVNDSGQSRDVVVSIPGGITIPTNPSMPSTFALRFESSEKGDVQLTVAAANAGGTILGTGMATIKRLTPGKVAAPVLVTLIKGAKPPDTLDGGTTTDVGHVADGANPQDAGGPMVDGSATDLPPCIFDNDARVFDHCVFAQ